MSASTFRCPNCNEFVLAGSAKCRFCSVPIDSENAVQAIQRQGQINSACNSASQLRNLAGAMWLTFFASYLIGLAGIGTAICFFAVPIWALIWATKYMRITAPDINLRRAKRDFFIAAGLWLLMGITSLVLIVLAIRAIMGRR